MDKQHKTLLKKLRQRKVITIDESAKLFSCSVVSARRKLKAWDAFTSCNRNGKFYTLLEITDFDESGLWWYEEILFSQHGNLKNTLRHLIDTSSCGLSGKELSALTGVMPNNPIVYQLRDKGQLRLEKHEKRMVLFSIDDQNWQKQRTERSRIKPAILPKCEHAVAILIEMIKMPGIDIQGIAVRLRKRGIKILEESIKALLVKHNLLKKTPDLKS